MNDNTNIELLLKAAASLVKESETKIFTLGDLTVRAWQLSPQKFGIVGYRKLYPDIHRVKAYIYGKNGMIAKGLIKKATKDDDYVTYTLTKNGSSYSDNFLTQRSCEHDSVILHMLRSRAYLLSSKSVTHKITFQDAIAFFGILDVSRKHINKGIHDTLAAINWFETFIEDEGEIHLSTEVSIDIQRLCVLRNLHSLLQSKFNREFRINSVKEE